MADVALNSITLISKMRIIFFREHNEKIRDSPDVGRQKGRIDQDGSNSMPISVSLARDEARPDSDVDVLV